MTPNKGVFSATRRTDGRTDGRYLERKDGNTEPAIFTSGDDVATVARFLAPGATSYKAADVIEHLLSPVPAS